MVVDQWRGDLGVESGAQCDDVIAAAQAAIVLAHSPEAEPWADVLHYRTIVDGEIYRPRNSVRQIVPSGESWVGRAEDLLYAGCSGASGDTNTGLDSGVHRVRFEADLFAGGAPVTLSTDEVEVVLRCRRIGGGCSVGGTAPIGAGLYLLLALALLLRRRRV
jgi:MYXO-CTERM domain-containing protein